MTLQELLNSDMDLASIAALARQGFTWWVDELAALLPAGWRERLSSRPRTLAEPATGGGWRFWRDRHPIEESALPRGATDAVGLLLPAGAVLVREVPAPRMPAADVRRMLSLDIDRLSPLAPDLIHFDLEVVDRDAGDGKQRVLLGIVPRAAALEVVRAARADGLAPVSLGVRSREDPVVQRFDFLPAVLAATGEATGGGVGRYWWGAVAALMVINLAVLVGRDMASVSRLKSMVDAQRPAVSAVLGLRRRVEAEDGRRRDLIARGQRGEPLKMLNALTEALPPGAWVQHLEWNGQSLRIVGYRAAEIDLGAALRGSGVFTNPRALTASPASGPTPIRPFDVTADTRGRP